MLQSATPPDASVTSRSSSPTRFDALERLTMTTDMTTADGGTDNLPTLCTPTRAPSPIPDEDVKNELLRMHELDKKDSNTRDPLPHIDEDGNALAVVPQASLERYKKRLAFKCPASIVKIKNLPRYATPIEVRIAVANALHKDQDEAPSSYRLKTTGRANFDLLLELRYSSGVFGFAC